MSASLHAAIVLAAGGSRRLGRPKQLVEFDGVTLLRRAALAALATAPLQTLVVLGADAGPIRDALHGLPVEPVDCADWNEGMGASLRAGVAGLRFDVDAALVVLCDQPALDAAHLNALLGRWRDRPERAVASRYAGVRGAPAVLPMSWLRELAALRGDAGARELLRGRDDVIDVVNEALAHDVDLPRDLPESRGPAP